MPNTFSQIFLHVVFAVKFRRAQIPLDKRDEIYNYISGIVFNHGCKLMCIGGVTDHVHLLIRLSTSVAVAKLIQSVKVGSSNFITHKQYHPRDFHWQDGYGVFSVSPNHVEGVTKYINNQIEHHLGTTFLDEYKQLLDRNEVAINPIYIFREME